jgi:hypothetical protein
LSYLYQKNKEAEKFLSDMLEPELKVIVEAVSSEPGSTNSYFIQIPDASSIDLHVDDLASLVARTSNIYGRAARFAGMARAECKLAEGRYKRKFKLSRKGKNEAEREEAGMEAAQEEFLALTVSEAIVELAESMEAAARIASESARKLYDKVSNMNTAYSREMKGQLQEKDWVKDF